MTAVQSLMRDLRKMKTIDLSTWNHMINSLCQ